MPPDNRRRDPGHDDWRWAMGRVWKLYPSMTFMATLDNELVCYGGFIHCRPQASNENSGRHH